MPFTPVQLVMEAMKTPPTNTRRSRLTREPERASGCADSLCGLLPLIQRAVSGRSGPHMDAKLDELAEKIDIIANRITFEDIQPRDESATMKVLEEAERDGIEVARYSQIPQFDASILDTYIPRCTRLTQLHFGAIVSNPHAPMAFKEKMGYNMTYNLVPPAHGNALHMHRSIEIFVALDGRWEIAWGMQGENTVVLQPWDFVAVPARVCHSYKNIEGQTAHNIMTILPGRSWITWAPNVVAEARKNGAECDENGVLTKYAHLVADTKGLASSSDSVPWKSMGPDEMAPYLHRFSEGRPFECQMAEEAEGGEAPFIEMFWRRVKPDGSVSLPRKAGVDMLLVVLDGSILVKANSGRPVAAAGRLDAVRVPRQALQASEVVISNPCPSPCTLLVTVTQMRSHNDGYFHLC